MLFHVPKLLLNFEKRHKWQLLFFLGKMPYEFMLAMVFMILPAIIAAKSDSMVAGTVKSAVLFISAFIFAPVSGNLADIFGAKKLMSIAAILTVIIGIIWISLPLTTLSLALIMFLFYMRAHLNTTDTYLLRTTDKRDGGVIFGISDNFWCFSTFVASLLLPVFILLGQETWTAILMIVTGTWYFFVVQMVPDDAPKAEQSQSISLWKSLNILTPLVHGWHFIKKNNGYPLIRIGYKTYISIFKGAIWFLLPIHLASLGLTNMEDSLPLGIYELTAAFFAGIMGYLSDVYDWRHMNMLGWGLILFGLALLPWDISSAWLIGVGALIGMGNNLAYASATHVLEEKDDDHEEDGSFVATESIVASIAEGCVPVLSGLGYKFLGFQTTMAIICGVCFFIGLLLLFKVYELKKAKE